MYGETLLYIHAFHKRSQKSNFSENLMLLFLFVFFSCLQIAIIIVKTRSTQNHTFVKYCGIIIFLKRNTDDRTGELKIFHKKYQNMVDFLDVIFNFFKFHVFCLQTYAWLESYDRHNSFGTKILESIIVNPALSSCNTLSVTHLDTASNGNLWKSTNMVLFLKEKVPYTTWYLFPLVIFLIHP